MLPAEVQMLIRNNSKVCGNHKAEIALLGHVPFKRLANNMLNHWKVQKRLAALEFDFDIRRRGAEYEIDGLIRSVGSHIEFRLVVILARHLAVGARVFAA